MSSHYYSQMAALAAAKATAPCSRLRIFVSCRNLLSLDSFSTSDPVCVMYTVRPGSDDWEEVGRTEAMENSTNPDFRQQIELSFLFEEVQEVKFVVYDVDGNGSPLTKIIGEFNTRVGLIVSARNAELAGPLVLPDVKKGKKRGSIIVRAEEVAAVKGTVRLQISGHHLDKKDWFGKSDPYVVFSRLSDSGAETVFHKTETVLKTLNPVWKVLEMPVSTFCNGDFDRKIEFKVFDWDLDGSDELIGQCVTSLNELLRPDRVPFELVSPELQKKNKEKYKNSGMLSIECTFIDSASFLDYLNSGMNLNFTVAVDYTASNGQPEQPTSLHYWNPMRPNEYAEAILAVGAVIQDYDSDKLFPALGFGAKMPDGSVLHEFALNGDPSNPYCRGIEGVLTAYHNSFQFASLWGPTNFAPVINNVRNLAEQCTNGDEYNVLLIITDGVVTDMNETIEAIIEASKFPMSIIIVGVGSADFTAMELLDGDATRLSLNGQTVERDIVQFVPFRDFKGSDRSMALAREVLMEVPGQVVEYMKNHGIKPKSITPEIKMPSANMVTV